MIDGGEKLRSETISLDFLTQLNIDFHRESSLAALLSSVAHKFEMEAN